MSQTNPFLVDRIVPERQDGGQVFQVSAESVSPTRVIGYDEAGFPVEETVCMLAKAAKFVDNDGNICEVPLRTGRVPNNAPEHERYELMVIRDLLSQGQLPLAECPYTTKYFHIKSGPLVKPREGETMCDGAPDGCKHMKRVIEERRAKGLAKWQKHQAVVNSLDKSTVQTMMAEFGKLFTNSKAELNKTSLVKGQGEKDR